MEITTDKYYRLWSSTVMDGYSFFYNEDTCGFDSVYEEQSIVDITYIIKHIQRR